MATHEPYAAVLGPRPRPAPRRLLPRASATATPAILTDYSGGDRGASLDPGAVQLEADRFLTDLDLVFPGAHAAAGRVGGDIVAHLEHWPSNPLTPGSYTRYLPGQFTTIAGLEGIAEANLFFAGEHTNSLTCRRDGSPPPASARIVRYSSVITSGRISIRALAARLLREDAATRSSAGSA